MFVLSNACLSALFIARFFAFAFKYKFNFKDMMKPLKKTLKRLMFVRRMRSSGKVKNALKRSLKRTRNRVINYGFFLENTIGSIISNILIFFEVRRMKTILCYKRGIHFKRFRTLRYFYFDFLKNYHIYKSA